MRFALIGAAGYIAPRHMQAIKDVGGELVAAMDPHYGVGILDRYFHECEFFTSYDRFVSFLERIRDEGKGIDYLSVASPNNYHAEHIIMGLNRGANVICEKPVVLNSEDVARIKKAEMETGRKVYTILQLRLHPKLIELKEKIANNNEKDVMIKYITPRGKWYFESWKGDDEKSGGVATNIGIHFFDLMMWLFGSYKGHDIHHYDSHSMKGIISLDNAKVSFHLSINPKDAIEAHGKIMPYRSITIDGEELEFSDVFTDLHTESYIQILAGKGFGIEEAEKSILLVSRLRNKK
jgi:UDP-N-acetyl-2-amino-2-deoxyglucuronate dehydrogenase